MSNLTVTFCKFIKILPEFHLLATVGHTNTCMHSHRHKNLSVIFNFDHTVVHRKLFLEHEASQNQHESSIHLGSTISLRKGLVWSANAQSVCWESLSAAMTPNLTLDLLTQHWTHPLSLTVQKSLVCLLLVQHNTRFVLIRGDKDPKKSDPTRTQIKNKTRQ